MKTREIKQQDLEALTQQLQNSTSAMVVSFTGVTVAKDQEFRNSIREAGANYQVVKNTLARIAVKGTQFEQATDAFKGVTAIAWTENDPVILSKAISKFMKDNADRYTFKTGVVDGKSVDLAQLTTIANLPSKEELISKLLFVLNAQAQRIVTVINAVPRDLAIVIKQIGEKEDRVAATPAPKAEATPADEAGGTDATAGDDAAEMVADSTPAGEARANEGVDDASAQAVAEETAPAEATSSEAQEESAANAPDDAAVEATGSEPAGDTPAAE